MRMLCGKVLVKVTRKLYKVKSDSHSHHRVASVYQLRLLIASKSYSLEQNKMLEFAIGNQMTNEKSKFFISFVERIRLQHSNPWRHSTYTTSNFLWSTWKYLEPLRNRASYWMITNCLCACFTIRPKSSQRILNFSNCFIFEQLSIRIPFACGATNRSQSEA